MRHGVLLSAIVSNGVVTLAHAQTDTETVLEEVLVTAERRESDLQKTAVAISVLSAEGLRDQAKNDLTEALRVVAGVAARDDINQAPTVVIRGIAPAQFTDPTVNISNDGVYQLYGGSSPTFDLERIEVLKGPQGTLFGRNSTGGAVNIVTAAPGDQLGGYTALQLGNYDARRIEGALDLPVGDVVQTRTAVLYSKRDGYLSNGNQDEDTLAVREKVHLNITDDLKLLLTGEYSEFGGQGQGVVAAPLASRNDPWYSPNGPSAQDTKKVSGNVVLDWDLGGATVFFQSAYEDYRPYTDQNVENPGDSYTLGKYIYTTATDELRISSPADSTVIWQAGLYYLHATSRSLPFAEALLPDQPHAANTAQNLSTRDSKAVFGQTTFPLADRLRATLGARYTEDSAERGVNIFDSATRALTTVARTPSRDDSALTYKAGLEFDVADDSMLYANISKGYKSGGVNEVGSVPVDYQPEYNLAYELGSKNRFLDDALQFNMDVYYYDYTDMQVVAVGPASIFTAPFPTTPVQNAGKAEIYGAEAELQWLITPVDRISTTAAYNHARFKEFNFFAIAVAAGPNGPVFNTVVTDVSGTAVPNAPLWTETLAYEHTFELGNAGQLTASGNVLYASGHNVDVNPSALDRRQPTYHLFGARLMYKPGEGNWSVGAYGNNLSNEAIRTRTYVPSAGVTNLFIGAPRTFGATFNVNF